MSKRSPGSLRRVRHGEIRRLIINMPPRSLKSIAASVAFPAFVLGHDPSRRIICVSYSGDLAKKHSNDFRAVLESPWYRSAFPTTRIGPFKNSETEIELTARGFRLATSVGGTLTGRGGEIIVIDDPLKPDDALSETKRSAANQWFTNTLLSRLDDKRTGAIVVVMQRVHIDDLTGFLLAQSDEWEVLSLPAVADSDEIIPLSAERTYRRQSGEALSPEREPLHVLEALKLQIGSDAFSAQYQQAPAPPGGAMVKRHWIKRYTELPPASAHPVHAAKLGHRQQGRPGQRLVGLHDLDRDTQEALVSHRRVAAARRLPRAQGKRADPRQEMERAACSGRGRRRRNLARPGAARMGFGNHRRKTGGRQGESHGGRLRKIRGGPSLAARTGVMVARSRIRALRLPRQPARRPMRFDQPGAPRQKQFMDDVAFTRRLEAHHRKIKNSVAIARPPLLYSGGGGQALSG